MARVIVDTNDLAALSLNLGAVTGAALVEVQKVLQRGAGNIVRQMQDDVRSVSAAGHLDRVPYGLGWTQEGDDNGLSIDIGNRIARKGVKGDSAGSQGPLAWVGFEGTATMPPLWPDPSIAMEAEAENIERFIGDVLDGLL